MAKSTQALAAIRSATALLRDRLGSESPTLGSFQATSAIWTLSQFPDPESFLRGIADLERPADASWPRNPDPKAEAFPAVRKHLRTVLGWSPAEEQAAIKPVVRTVLDLLAEPSTYPQTLEMISFLGTLAGLVPAPRLPELLELVADTPSAFRPLQYPAQVMVGLRLVLSHYPLDRRMVLLADLWRAAHDGAWWNHTSEVRPRGGHLEAVLDDDNVRDLSPEALAVQLASGRYQWHPSHVRLLPRVRVSSEQRAAILRLLADPRVEPDLEVASSFLQDLAPHQRADSPIPRMVEILASQYRDVEDISEVAPPQPETWVELYAPGDHKRFPIPAEVLMLHNKEFPGLPGSEVAVCRSRAELRFNGDYMGNCTFSAYHSAAQDGSVVFLRVRYGRQVLNVSFFPQERRIGEVNSRFNGTRTVAEGSGPVPLEVQNAFHEWARSLPRL